MLPAAVAATSNMSRDEALSVLRKHACARDPILHAVYDYWRGKRERLNRPIMRRLQVRWRLLDGERAGTCGEGRVVLQVLRDPSTSGAMPGD